MGKLVRPRTASKNVWSKEKTKFEKAGHENFNLVTAFETRFVLPYKVCVIIFSHTNFEKTFPEVRVISKEDAFLAFLYRLNKGCEFSTLADVFGGSPDTHSRTFGKYLDASLVFFKKTIQIPSKTECTDMKMKLLKHGFPNPQAVFIGEA